jgi:patatin-related protein
MKEKELRLALVCYGGVSLAVYMYGVTREIQKLLYASKVLHNVRDAETRHSADAAAACADAGREIDSETGYFRLLQIIGAHLELRVLVDIIAGASAGGINGVFLAQAIAQNAPLDSLRDTWLVNADIEKLLDDESASGKWSKFYLRPLVWLFGKWQDRQVEDFLGPGATAEMRSKLSRFVRSRWFKPPFSGVGFARMLYDATRALATSSATNGSLLPPGYPLDLYVTVTDYYGYTQKLRLNSPSEISEREHRLIIGFHDAGSSAENIRSLGSAADLSFAARATASFPGAFPPAQLREMDEVVRSAGHVWVDRQSFVSRAFRRLLQAGSDPERAAFIDGSVLNNKPFGAAIEALGRRPAHREVDRRIVYIEPNPRRDMPRGAGKAPGFFSALRGSLSDIPRNQPIRDELEWVQNHSLQVERMNQVIEGMRDDVQAAIAETLGPIEVGSITGIQLRGWRIDANRAAGRNAGFTYAAYVELKVARMFDALALHLSRLAAEHGESAGRDLWRARLESWAHETKVLPLGSIHKDVRAIEDQVAELAWVQLLRGADAHFRVRRLRFVIRTLNRLYGNSPQGLDHRHLDQAKQDLYAALADITDKLTVARTPGPLCRAAALLDDPATVMEMLVQHFDLHNLDDLTDTCVADALMHIPNLDIRRELTQAFVGFAFFDIATFPMLQSLALDEYDEIKVDRISPEDANAVRPGGARACLKGTNFGSFGAFFSRAYRENDYLWGRLHGADRLVDIIASSLDAKTARTLPLAQIKRDIFAAILAREEPMLKHIPEVFDQIRRDLDARAAEAAGKAPIESH